MNIECEMVLRYRENQEFETDALRALLNCRISFKDGETL